LQLTVSLSLYHGAKPLAALALALNALQLSVDTCGQEGSKAGVLGVLHDCTGQIVTLISA